MEFSFTAQQVAGRVVLTVAGDVDLAAHARFEAAVEQGWPGSCDLVVDCSGVTFLDSMGLRVLVQTMRQATDKGYEFTLAAPSASVLRVLELAGVKDLFSIVDSSPDAAAGAPSAPDPDSDPYAAR